MTKIVRNEMSFIQKGDIYDIFNFLNSKNINIFGNNNTIFEKSLLKICIIIYKYDLIILNEYKVQLKNREGLIGDTILEYSNNKNQINKLLQYYDIEQIIDFSLMKNQLLYTEFFDIYDYHIRYVDYFPNYMRNISIDSIKLECNISILKNNNYSDISNALGINIYYNKQLIFTSGLYIGKHQTFISNLQYKNDYFIHFSERTMKLHRIGLLFAYKISKYLKITTMIGYSNDTHCAKYHKGFQGKYNNYLKSFGFKGNNEGYFLFHLDKSPLKTKYKKKYLFIDDYLKLINI